MYSPGKPTDKNTVIGLILIFVIIIGFNLYQASQTEELKEEIPTEQETTPIEAQPDQPVVEQQDTLPPDSVAETTISEKEITIETDVFHAVISNKGATFKTLQLKNYDRYDSLPVSLIKDNATFNFEIETNSGRYSSAELTYETSKTNITVSGKDSAVLVLKAPVDGGYIEHRYVFRGDNYLIDYSYLAQLPNKTITGAGLHFNMKTLNQEKLIENERNYTNIFYKDVSEDEVEELGPWYGTRDDSINTGKVAWVAFQQQFFTTALLTEKNTAFQKATLVTNSFEEDSVYLKKLKANLSFSAPNTSTAQYHLELYFGPSELKRLRAIDDDLDEVIALGISIFRWVNIYFIYPLFNVLSSFIGNIGLIILVMAIAIKLIVTPFTYKTYLSQIKMRLLKPEIDDIKKKHKDDMQAIQREQMQLYGKAGVNPLGGCLPMLFQMPILIAMYRFFPSNIELRQRSFLWADDLSSYDSIFDLPFNIPFYGDHVSLFTLLMTITTFVYTRMSSQSTPDTTGQMKMFQYIMPIMLLGFFNNFSAALSYYYLLFNVLSIVQQSIMKKFFINEKALRVKIEQNKRNPKKSKFQQRLEEMMKQQQQGRK